MNFNKIIIPQWAGIGDVLFCQKITTMLYEQYQVPIIWPLREEILWIKDYIESPVTFSLCDDQFIEKYSQCKQPQIVDNELIIPFCSAIPKVFGGVIMECKYLMCKLDHINWQDYIKIKRNYDKEAELYDKIVGDTTDYIYVNKIYGTPPILYESTFMQTDIPGNIIQHQVLPEYTLFDWLQIAENAKEIHTVSSGNFYVFESLTTPLPPITMYNRSDIYNLRQLDFLRDNLRKNWTFHESSDQI